MREFFRRYVLKDFGLKFLSLVVAVFLWWAVGRDPMVEKVMSAPIEFQHAPENLDMTTDTSFQAQVTVRGPRRSIRAITASEINAVIDLSGVHPGERTFELGPKQIRVPRDVQVVEVVPAQIHINFAPNVTRTVEVHPRVIGTFAAGYGITEVSSDPAQITITGPANRVHAIEAAITDPVDATGVVGRATFATHAYVPDPLVRVLNPAAVHVTVTTGKSSKGATQP